MPAEHQTIKLGESEYVLVPQKHTYLKRRLGTLFSELGDIDVSAGSLMDVIGDKLYEVVSVFVPGVMSREAWEDDETAPTFPQIEDAIVIGLRVNGLNRVGALGKVISPEMIRALVNQQVAQLVASSMTTSSLSSPPPSGEPTPTTSSMTPPTSDPIPVTFLDEEEEDGLDGPSSESAPSSPPVTDAGFASSAT